MSINKQTENIGERIGTNDFPRVPWTPAFGVRKALSGAYNYCRRFPNKMQSLKTILLFTLSRIDEWEKAQGEVGSYEHAKATVDPLNVRKLDAKMKPVQRIKPNIKQMDTMGEVPSFTPPQVELAHPTTMPQKHIKAPVTTVTEVPKPLAPLQAPSPLPNK